jgi:hypothetical protein
MPQQFGEVHGISSAEVQIVVPPHSHVQRPSPVDREQRIA